MPPPPRIKPHQRQDAQNNDYAPGNADIVSGTVFEPYLRDSEVTFCMETIRSTATGKDNVRITMTSSESNIGGDIDNGYYIAVKPGESWRILFKLSSQIDWEFDINDPISFKDKEHISSQIPFVGRKEKNYSVSDITSNGFILTITSIHNPNTHVPPSDPGKSHPFNIYVKIRQSSLKLNAFRIDPDVKNPPPGGNLFHGTVPANTPVPI
jgi:hypothetical protein